LQQSTTLAVDELVTNAGAPPRCCVDVGLWCLDGFFGGRMKKADLSSMS
jgi:hypothetical protein